MIKKDEGKVNSPSSKVLPAGKTLVRRKSAEGLAQRRTLMPNGIIIIDKPAGWTSMDVCVPRGR